MEKKANSREMILDAAEEVLIAKGARHFSIDMVVKQAGVSKGGVMYHFPSKQSLIMALVQRRMEHCARNREKAFDALPESKGRLLRAALMAFSAPNERRDSIGLAILAALAEDRSLLLPLKEKLHEYLQEVKNTELPFERSMVASLASDGLMFWDLLGINPLTPQEREEVTKELLGIVDEMEAKA